MINEEYSKKEPVHDSRSYQGHTLNSGQRYFLGNPADGMPLFNIGIFGKNAIFFLGNSQNMTASANIFVKFRPGPGLRANGDVHPLRSHKVPLAGIAYPADKYGRVIFDAL